MRCPQCNERNSVAARSCKSCGTKLKRKPLPLKLKLTFGLFASLIAVWGVASAVVPSLTDPEEGLQRSGKRMAAGPKSPEDADRMRKEFDQSVRAYLSKFGNLEASELQAKIQTILPSVPFEVHVFDFPRKLKLVEIDTVLQPSDYLVIKSRSDQFSKRVKVYPIQGLEVFDTGQIINNHTGLADLAGSVFVALGHTGGQGVRHPQIKVLGLIADEMVDHTDSAVPPILGEGRVSFAPNQRDIKMDSSLYSIGVAEGLFVDVSGMVPVEDETIRHFLDWKDGRYTDRCKAGTSPLSALYAVAKCIHHPENAQKYSAYFHKQAIEFIDKSNPKPGQEAPRFAIRRVQNEATNRSTRHSKDTDKYLFLLSGTNESFHIRLARVKKPDGVPSWVVSSVKPLGQDSLVIEKKPSEPGKLETISSTTPQPASTQKKHITSGILDGLQKELLRKQQESRSHSDQMLRNRNVLQETAQAHSEGSRHKNDQVEIKEHSGRPAGSEPTSGRESSKKTRTPEGTQPVLFEGTTTDSIKIRHRPGTEYRTVQGMPKGSKVKVIGKENGWYKVIVNGNTGFVYGAFIDCKKSDAYTTATITKSKTIKDEHQRDVHKARPGDRFVILGGVKNDKYKVQLANGKTGYVEKDAVDVAVDVPQQVP